MQGSWLSRNWLWLITIGLSWALSAYLALREGQPERRWDVDPDGFPLDLPETPPARLRA